MELHQTSVNILYPHDGRSKLETSLINQETISGNRDSDKLQTGVGFENASVTTRLNNSRSQKVSEVIFTNV